MMLAVSFCFTRVQLKNDSKFREVYSFAYNFSREVGRVLRGVLPNLLSAQQRFPVVVLLAAQLLLTVLHEGTPGRCSETYDMYPCAACC